MRFDFGFRARHMTAVSHHLCCGHALGHPSSPGHAALPRVPPSMLLSPVKRSCNSCNSFSPGCCTPRSSVACRCSGRLAASFAAAAAWVLFRLTYHLRAEVATFSAMSDFTQPRFCPAAALSNPPGREHRSRHRGGSDKQSPMVEAPAVEAVL